MDEQNEVARWLTRAGAQNDVVSWARQHVHSWSGFWLECPRGDWLLAVAARAGVPTEVVLDAARACLPVLEPYLLIDEPVIQRALAYIRASRTQGLAPQQHALISRELEALLAVCADPAAHAGVLALSALLFAIEDPQVAATFVAATVQAAVMDAGDCAMMEAARYTEYECARLVREAVDVSTVMRALGQDD